MKLLAEILWTLLLAVFGGLVIGLTIDDNRGIFRDAQEMRQ